MTQIIEAVKIKDHEDYILWPDGQVFSLKTNKFLSPVLHKYSQKNSSRKNIVGYIKINFNNKQFYIHRLLAQAFIPNPEGKPCVNHKDGNKLNNSLDNLEWVTEQGNQKHAFDTGLKQGVFGKIIRLCSYCDKEYQAHYCRGDKTKFCSISCGTKHRNSKRVYSNSKVLVTCFYCQKESYKWPGRIKGNTFCNQSCTMNYMNKIYLPAKKKYFVVDSELC